MYIDPKYTPRKPGRVAHVFAFERFLLENRAHALFDA
jgi:hypothetical protein